MAGLMICLQDMGRNRWLKGAPWDQWPPGGSLVQLEPGLWRGDEQPASFQNVARGWSSR